MKYTLALAIVLAAIAAAVCDTSDVVFSSSSNDILDSTNGTELDVGVGLFSARNRHLHTAYISRGAISNTVLIHDHTYRGSSSTRITRVRAAEIGGNPVGSARIISGGLAFSFVTVRLTSVRGRGFYYQIDVWG